MNTLIRICIYLTFAHDPVIEVELVKAPEPCSQVQQTAATDYCHVSISRSTNLVDWYPFADGDYPDYSTLTIYETINRPAGYYRIETGPVQ